MKTYIIFIIAAFFTLSLRSQSLPSPASQSSSSVIKQKLDSILISSWDSTGTQWKISSKYDFTYDVAGNMILSYSYGWTTSTQQWRARTKFEQNYDFFGMLSYSESYNPDTIPGAWRPNTKHEYTFDPNKNIVSDIQLNWSADSSGLIYSSKYEYTYNISGRLTTLLGYVVNSKSQWQARTQNNYGYNGSGNLTVETDYEMDLVNHQWYPTFKNNHSYDTAGNRIMTIYSQSDTGAVSWKYISKTEYEYSSGKMTLQTDYQFSATDSIWNLQSQEERIYTGNGDMSEKYNYTWDQVNNQWVPVSNGKLVCDYNTSFDLSELILPPGFENYNSDHQMIDKFQYHWNGTQWNQLIENNYYYSEKNLGIPENSLAFCQVYPNPARDHVGIDWPGLKGDLQVSIYNFDGVMVFSRMLPAKTTVSLKNLPAGEYMLKITGNQKTTATRLIIQ